MTTIYLLDAQSIYIGTQEVDPYAALPFCTLTPPPQITGTEVALWRPSGWRVLSEYPYPAPPAPPSNEVQSGYRKAAYEQESDSIFFLIQRGEATTEEWNAKIAEIKARFPYYYDEQGNLLEVQA